MCVCLAISMIERDQFAQYLYVHAGDGNSHHYFVATQDQELRRHIRKFAGSTEASYWPCSFLKQDSSKGQQSTCSTCVVPLYKSDILSVVVYM